MDQIRTLLAIDDMAGVDALNHLIVDHAELARAINGRIEFMSWCKLHDEYHAAPPYPQDHQHDEAAPPSR